MQYEIEAKPTAYAEEAPSSSGGRQRTAFVPCDAA